MRDAVESKYQTLHDRLCSSSGLMDKVPGMIEENHLELVALDEVIAWSRGNRRHAWYHQDHELQA